MGGQIVDATIVQAPKQRMTAEEKEIVKRGDIPEEWKKKPRKLARRGFIRKWQVSDASRYDGYELESLIDPDNAASDIWGDTAYGSKANRKMLERHGLKADICRKKPKGKPMSERVRKANSRRSKVRAFVEHPFAHLKGPMRLFIRAIGIARAKTRIGMANLACNFRRYIFRHTRAA